MRQHKVITETNPTGGSPAATWKECRCCGATGWQLILTRCPCEHLDGGGWASVLGDYGYCGRARAKELNQMTARVRKAHQNLQKAQSRRRT